MDNMNNYRAGGNARMLINPDIKPETVVLEATAGAGVTQLYFADALGMGEITGAIGGANSQALDVIGLATPAVVRTLLSSYALIIGGYNFYSSVESDLANNLKLIRTTTDENSSNEILFSSLAVTNTQENKNLLIINRPFVWTMQTALRIGVTAATKYTFTFKVVDMVAYGDLDEYLVQNPQYVTPQGVR